MSTISYTCPSCGAPLGYDAESGKLLCAACQSSYEIDSFEAPAAGEGVRFDLPTETFSRREMAQMHAYICQGCGAELMTDDTTTATECPYCGSPTVLPDQIERGVRPQLVVPFVITKEQAQKTFEDYFKGKRLMPNVFLNSRNRIADMRKLYVPYWLFDCAAGGAIAYNAEKRHTCREGEWEVTYIDHYIVERAGGMIFENIPVDGSEKLDNQITESLEPYDLSQAVPFSAAVLAGALADHADVDAEVCQSRARERVESSVVDALRGTVGGYTSVSERSRNIFTKEGKITPVLMPVWLITTEKEGKVYTFAINGQTGALTCDVPPDTAKSLVWGFGTFALSMGLFTAALYMLEFLDGMMIAAAALFALIIALFVVGTLMGQLTTAESRKGAQEYAKPGSFELSRRSDRFLYQTTHRQRIETQNNNKN